MTVAPRRPANPWRTLARLLPALPGVLWRSARQGRDGISFIHPRAITRGQIRFGRYCEVGPAAFLNAGSEGIAIGTYSQINPNVSLIGNVTIGDRVLIAPGAVLTSGGHRFGRGIQPRFHDAPDSRCLVIGHDCWIGANATILGGITIGAGSVIGAGVVIDRDVAPGMIVRRPPMDNVIEPLR